MHLLKFNATGPDPIELTDDLGAPFSVLGSRRCDLICLTARDVQILAGILTRGSEVQRDAMGELLNSSWLTMFRPGRGTCG